MINKKWTKKETQLLVEGKSQKMNMADICIHINKIHGMNRSVQDCYGKYYYLQKTGKIVGKNKIKTVTRKHNTKRTNFISWNQEMVDYIHAAFRNNFPQSVIIAGFKEQFGRNINSRQIDYAIRDKTPTNPIIQQKIKEEKKEVKPINVKAWHNDTATRKQCARLMALTYPTTNGKDRNLMTKELYASGTLSKKEAHDRIHSLTVQMEKIIHSPKLPETIETIFSEVIEEITPEVIEESSIPKSLLPRLNRTRHKWTEEEELELLCDFYELSIDEARERFQRPFYAIAKRLEKIVDSTEPKYIDMLVKASKVIKQRKRASDEAAKNGFLKRRRLRKQAKKVIKLEKKLSKLRGE